MNALTYSHHRKELQMKLDSKDVYRAIEGAVNNAKQQQEWLGDDPAAAVYNVVISSLEWVRNEIDYLVEKESETKVTERRNHSDPG
jgi:ribonuclease HI